MDDEQVIYRTGPGGAVEVLRSSRKLTFICTKCGCKFRVPYNLAPSRQTGLQEYMHSYNCPECGDECLSS